MAADHLLENILEALQQVSQYPFSGSELIVGGRRPRAYRKLYVHPYNIFYRIIDETVVVMRVLHEKMDGMPCLSRKHYSKIPKSHFIFDAHGACGFSARPPGFAARPEEL